MGVARLVPSWGRSLLLGVLLAVPAFVGNALLFSDHPVIAAITVPYSDATVSTVALIGLLGLCLLLLLVGIVRSRRSRKDNPRS